MRQPVPQAPQAPAAPAQDDQEPELGGEEGPEEGMAGEPRAAKKDKETKRQLAQLHKFGEAEPLVELLAELIRVRAALECAFADMTPSPNQPNGPDGRESCSRLLVDDWILEEWPLVNTRLREEQAMIPFKDCHRRYVSPYHYQC